MLSEQELIKECINGNKNCQKQLYDKYSSLFYAVCLRYMPDSMMAEDALIEGFTTIFSKLDTFEFRGSFEGWMKRIIINTALTTLRANGKHFLTESADNKHELIGQQENIYSTMNVKDIMKLIQELPVGYRTVFNLCAIEGYSYQETADLMGVEIGTVRSQLSRARKAMQTKLKNYR